MEEMYEKELNFLKEELKKIREIHFERLEKAMKIVIKNQGGLIKKVKEAQAACENFGKAMAEYIPKKLK